MLDKTKFLEMLQSILEVARTQGNALTQEEIREYFQGMGLEQEHYNHIYAYLGENKIEVKGVSYQPLEEKEPSSQAAQGKKGEPDSRFLKMYLKDLKGMERLGKSQEEQLTKQLISGEEDARKRLMEHWLLQVVDIAREYAGRGALLEDLIQEGNMGLLDGAQRLFGSGEPIDGAAYLRESVEKAMADYIGQIVDSSSWRSALVAKANLLSEAAKYLAQEYGRVATAKELSDYARIPLDEVEDILSLSKDAIKVGKGEARTGAQIIDWSKRTQR